jgi:hypothetical protein
VLEPREADRHGARIDDDALGLVRLELLGELADSSSTLTGFGARSTFAGFALGSTIGNSTGAPLLPTTLPRSASMSASLSRSIGALDIEIRVVVVRVARHGLAGAIADAVGAEPASANARLTVSTSASVS